MSKTSFCVHIDVRGALLNWADEEFENMFSRPGGGHLPAREAKAALLDELAKGHVVIPCGDCEGFDPTGGGCPGHAVEG